MRELKECLLLLLASNISKGTGADAFTFCSKGLDRRWCSWRGGAVVDSSSSSSSVSSRRKGTADDDDGHHGDGDKAVAFNDTDLDDDDEEQEESELELKGLFADLGESLSELDDDDDELFGSDFDMMDGLDLSSENPVQDWLNDELAAPPIDDVAPKTLDELEDEDEDEEEEEEEEVLEELDELLEEGLEELIDLREVIEVIGEEGQGEDDDEVGEEDQVLLDDVLKEIKDSEEESDKEGEQQEEGGEDSEELTLKSRRNVEKPLNLLGKRNLASSIRMLRTQVFKLLFLHVSFTIIRGTCHTKQELFKSTRVMSTMFFIACLMISNYLEMKIQAMGSPELKDLAAQQEQVGDDDDDEDDEGQRKGETDKAEEGKDDDDDDDEEADRQDKADLLEMETVSFLGRLMGKTPETVLVTAQAHDAHCLEVVKRWCIISYMAGQLLAYLLGDPEPLYVGAALALLRMTAEPLFFAHVFRKNIPRPLREPPLFNAIFGSPFSLQ